MNDELTSRLIESRKALVTAQTAYDAARSAAFAANERVHEALGELDQRQEDCRMAEKEFDLGTRGAASPELVAVGGR